MEAVLIVDDHPSNTALMEMLLKQLGVSSCHCDNGLDAIAYCLENDPPLVLMDLHMPDMGGIETTRRIRASWPADRPRLPIVAVTADTSMEAKHASLTVGMDAFLHKPVKLQQLHQLIAGLLDLPPLKLTERKSPAPDDENSVHGLNLDIAAARFSHGDDAKMKRIAATMFAEMWEDVAPALERISRDRSRGDTKSGQERCHQLRGVLAIYGFHHAAELLSRMETDSAEFNRTASINTVRVQLELSLAALHERYPYLLTTAH